jgi:surface antigen
MSYFGKQLLVVFFSAASLASADAQLAGFYPITGDGVSLNNGDFALLIDAANNLLRRPHLTIGDSTSWHSEQTGSHGTIRVKNTFHHGSMLCRTLVYETNPTASPSSSTIKLNWCKTPDGWKILS